MVGEAPGTMAVYFETYTNWDILVTSKKGDTFHKNLKSPTRDYDIQLDPTIEG